MRIEQLATHPHARKALLLISLFLFPVTHYYFTRIFIFAGASKGVVNGSFLPFPLMFLSSLFLGRLWYGWGVRSARCRRYGSLGEALPH